MVAVVGIVFTRQHNSRERRKRKILEREQRKDIRVMKTKKGSEKMQY